MPSLRTQIYLTADQRERLDARARREKKTLARVIREAVDAYVTAPPADLATVLDQTFGIAPGFKVPSRDEWSDRDRRSGG